MPTSAIISVFVMFMAAIFSPTTPIACSKDGLKILKRHMPPLDNVWQNLLNSRGLVEVKVFHDSLSAVEI